MRSKKFFILAASLTFSIFFCGGCVPQHDLNGRAEHQEERTPPARISDASPQPKAQSEKSEARKLDVHYPGETPTDKSPTEWKFSESEASGTREIRQKAWTAPENEGEPTPTRHGKATLETPDFPVTRNQQVERFLDYFQETQRETFSNWLSHSSRYIPLVSAMLADAGLPRDLAYLPMIESGYDLSAYSSGGAAGPWQFIPSTAAHYGLRVDNYVDQRRDIVKSTEAAISLLSELYDTFGSWPLAIAGYNAGPNAVKNAMEKTGSRNFWEIAQTPHLGDEAKKLVPKLMAVILMARDPERYGHTDFDSTRPLEYETVRLPALTNLKAVALACNEEFDIIKTLNRDLLRYTTPPDASYPVKIPAGKARSLMENFDRLQVDDKIEHVTHRVREGENITSICEQYGINATTLREANNLRKSKLKSGQLLRIPQKTTTFTLASKNPSEASPQRVKQGETREKSRRRPQSEDNTSSSQKSINAGKYKSKSVASRQTTSFGETAKKAASVGGQKKKTAYYQVRGGDSLWDIAKRHNISTEELIRWNNIKGDNPTLHPGQRLVLQTD